MRETTATGWNGAAIGYLAIAIVGLLATWTFNIISIVEQRNYLGEWFGSGPSVMSLSLDVLVVAVCAIVFIVIEGRRLGMKRLWVYIVLIPFVALAFSLPLFLAMREREQRLRLEPHNG